ncbi:HAD family hydrolase [Ancrocorticia populi]|uniref:HAD family hydrolase n=1 Tax=Ancrocorticia populi TaxID=2175228 RepID=UPI003F90EEC6
MTTNQNIAETTSLDVALSQLRSYEVLLFDLDGVLTQTDKMHRKAWRAMFDEYFAQQGLEQFEDNDYFNYLDGKPRAQGVQSVLESRGVNLPLGEATDAASAPTVNGLANRKNECFLEAIQEGVEPYAGSEALLKVIKAADRTRLGVVTSSNNGPIVLEKSNLAHYFDLVLDGNVARAHALKGKPAPDTYLYACEQLGATPDKAAIFEDAVSGVQSGNAGGFAQVVGVNRGVGAQKLMDNGATCVVDDLAEFAQALEGNW